MRLWLLFVLGTVILSAQVFPPATAFTPPYLSVGSTKYLSTGYQVTLPAAPASWVGQGGACAAPTTTVTGPNGNMIYQDTVAGGCFGIYTTVTSSVESAFNCFGILAVSTTSNNACGIWIYDSTNSFLWQLIGATNTSAGAPPSIITALNQWTWSGSGNVNTFVAQTYAGIAAWPSNPNQVFRLRVAAAVLNVEVSLDGGATFQTISKCGASSTNCGAYATAVGTVTKGGVGFSNGILNTLSLKIQ